MKINEDICDRYGNGIKKSEYEENAYMAFYLFSSICQKNPKELKSPKKNGILKKKVDGVVEMNRKYEISTKKIGNS